jgi:hypothetical protein
MSLRSVTFATPPVLTQDSQGPQTVDPLTPRLADQILCIRRVSWTVEKRKGGCQRDCPESAVWRGHWPLLSLRCESLDRREPPRAVHRVLRICVGRAGVQLPSELCIHAAPGERIAAFYRGVFPGRTRGACLGSFGWSHLGDWDDLQFCGRLYADGWASDVVFAR